MGTKTPISKASAKPVVKDIRRAPRWHYSARDKIMIVLPIPKIIRFETNKRVLNVPSSRKLAKNGCRGHYK